MASASKKESTNKLLRSLLLAEKTGFPIEKLSAEYRGLVGEHIPYRAFGFNSLEQYLRSIPEVVSIRRNGDGSFQCFGMADESTQHIKSLVSRQKTSKKRAKPRYGGRPKPMQFRSRQRPVRGPPAFRAPPSRPAAFPRPTVRRGPANTGWGNKPSGFNQASSNQVRPSSSSSFSSKSSSNFKNTAGFRVPESTQRTSKPPSQPQQHTQSFSNKNSKANTSNTNKPPASGKWTSIEPSTKDTRNTAAPSQSTNEPRPPTNEPRPRIASTPAGKSDPGPKGQSDPGPKGQSAFVSVVDKKRSSSTSGSEQRQTSAPPRVLAPRFLKQMQKELEDQKNRDLRKENQRKAQAQQQLLEHNNNQELRITVANEKVNNNAVEDQENYSSKEEWPKRKVEQTASGDWRTPAVTERIIQSVPVSNSGKTRSDSPVSHSYNKEPARATPPPISHSPVTVALSTEDESLCKWFTKALDNKNSGLWRSCLDKEFKIVFSKSLTDGVLEKMVTLKIITIEKVFNQEIVYPNLKVVVNGTGSRHNSSSSGTSSPIDLGMANLSLQQNIAISTTDTPTTPTSPAPTSPSPVTVTPTSLVPTTPSPITVRSPLPTGDSSVPDYSHLAVPLPEDEVLEVYVSYIKNLQDFYVLIIDEDYSDKLFTLEEEMGHYYRYSRRKLQGPPAPGCMYAAELNKEWLRVMVDTVQDDHVSCFLVDHGDTERVESSKLQPLAPQFLHVPFQAIPCKLEGTEDDPENTEAVQKFCEVGLGQVLIAEILSKEEAQVEIILYEEEAVATVNDLCLSCI